MGDVWNIDIRELVDTIRAHAIPGTRILITTAPPCKDHSKIRDSPPGLQGQDGSLLQHMVDIEWSIRLSIPEHPIDSLMENVLPHDSIQEHFDDITDQWGTIPIVLDAADGHMLSRPRLWWNTIQWEPVQEIISSQTPWQLTWTKHPPYSKLHNPIAADLQPNIQMKGWETPNILTQGGLFHCLTTQAITDTGETTSTAYRRGSGHMGPLGTGTETIPTTAIPPTISHQRTPSRLATHHTATTGTTHGIARQLHTTNTRTTLWWQTEEYHAWERLASTDSYLATLLTTDPDNSTHPASTKDDGTGSDDSSVAQQSPTLWTPTQDALQRQHATTRLAISPKMGQITSRLILLPKTNRSNTDVGHTDTTRPTHAIDSTGSHTGHPTTDPTKSRTNNRLAQTPTYTLPNCIPTTGDDRPDTHTHLPTGEDTIPTHTHTHSQTGTQRWIPTTRTTTTRITMASQVRQQIHRTTVRRWPTNLQPGIHHQEVTTPICRRQLGTHGRRNCSRSESRPNERTILSTCLVPLGDSPITHRQTQTTEDTTPTQRPHHCDGIQHQTDRIRWESQDSTWWRLETLGTQPGMSNERPTISSHSRSLH